jgi:uncharacterized membrane protein YhaH (DUF805 family)
MIILKTTIFLGSVSEEVHNKLGQTIDLWWLNIVVSIISVATIIQASPWTVKPIQEETNSIVAILVFLPLFFYRMVAWMIIITLLHSFSLPVFAGFVLINMCIFYFAQEPIDDKGEEGETGQSKDQPTKMGQFEVEPLAHSFLSIIFPVSLMPTSNFKNTNNSLKLLFWLVLIGNMTLFGVLTILFALYSYDKYNPWCSDVSNNLLLPESLMNNINFLLMSLLSFATLPVMVCFVVKRLR